MWAGLYKMLGLQVIAEKIIYSYIHVGKCPCPQDFS